MGQIIVVVSGKGGTGKSAFVVGVGAALAELGKRVLCLDCDVGLRSLDLVMGLSDYVLMDFSDIIDGRTTLDRAIVQHPQNKNLHLLTAPVSTAHETLIPAAMRPMLRDIQKNFDFCLIDAPAGIGEFFHLATCKADRAVVVTTTDQTSMRTAQRTVMELRRFSQKNMHLVVNRVSRRNIQDMRITLDDAMDNAGLPLLGIVPEDRKFALCLNQETYVEQSKKSLAAQAYHNMARRLCGERVPLLRIPLWGI